MRRYRDAPLARAAPILAISRFRRPGHALALHSVAYVVSAPREEFLPDLAVGVLKGAKDLLVKLQLPSLSVRLALDQMGTGSW